MAVPNNKPFMEFIDEATAAGMPASDLLSAFLYHEHYIWNSARPRARQATVELRAACQQPWPDHMAATALGLGIVEGLTKVFYPEASSTVVFVIMVIVLLTRPAGLFGKEK